MSTLSHLDLMVRMELVQHIARTFVSYRMTRSWIVVHALALGLARHELRAQTSRLDTATAAVRKDDFIRRDGFRLYYRLLGAGRPVLLLSGGPGDDCDYLMPVARIIGRYGRAVLVELRGTGRSIPPQIDSESITVSKVLDDLEALRVHLGVPRWTVLGHSAGGALALYYAAAHPERIDKLILVDGAPIASQFLDAVDDNIRVRLTPAELARVDSLTAANAPPDSITLRQLPALFFSRAAAMAAADAFRRGEFGRDHYEIGRLLAPQMFNNMDLRPQLKRFRRPVLILNGRQDPIADARTAYETHLALPTSTLQFINRAGHFPWMEQPGEFADVLTAFLRR
jgi:proline iminopeptidase